MRWILASCLTVGVLSAAPSFVQGCVNSASAASVTCALSSNGTGGNLLVVTSKTEGTSSATPATLTASSSSGVSCTWSKVGSASAFQIGSNYASAQIAYCVLPSSGSETVQASWTGTTSGSFTDITVAEYSNATGWAASPLDVSLAASSGLTTTCAVGPTSTTTNANDLVIGVCMNWSATQTWGTATGYTNRSTASRSTTGFYDKSVTTIGTQSFSTTLSSGDVDLAMIATFRQASAVRILPNRVSF